MIRFEEQIVRLGNTDPYAHLFGLQNKKIKYYIIYSDEPFSAYDPHQKEWFVSEQAPQDHPLQKPRYEATYTENDFIVYAWMAYWKNHD